MTYALFVLALLLFAPDGQAQSTASNWTRTDCDGVEHSLFTELDKGSIVIMEFVMLPDCEFCIDAARRIKTSISSLPPDVSSRIRQYSIGYSDAYTCAALRTWQETYNLSTTLFEKGAALVEPYGGMGMPTIVIAAGGDHKVIYRKKGFSANDTTAILAAIHNFLSAGVASEGAASEEVAAFAIYPNPVSEGASLSFSSQLAGNANITIHSAIGQMLVSTRAMLFKGMNSITLPVSVVPGGYYITFTTEKGTVTLPFVTR